MAVSGATIHELAVGSSICLRIKFVTVSRINLWLYLVVLVGALGS